MQLLLLSREFTRNGVVWQIDVPDDRHAGIRCYDHNSNRHDSTNYLKRYGFKFRKDEPANELIARLRDLFRRMEEDGWVETERSRTRRVFLHTARPPGKFWIICLAGSRYEVRSGSFRGAGKLTEKEFTTAQRARDEYLKIITKKLAKGYREMNRDEVVPEPCEGE